MRTISEIYKNYKIPLTLQMHMLRVAAVAAMVCDHWQGDKIDKNKIVTVCLLHDIGNIIKFKFDAFPESFFEPQGISYWQEVQKEYFEKYGQDEHDATIQIIAELGLGNDIAELAIQNRFHLLCEHSVGDDFFVKIMRYGDLRVNPFGIVRYEDRMNEAGKRYSHKVDIDNPERLKLVNCGKDIENQIFAKCSIKPEDINDTTTAPYIEELKNFVI